MQAISQTFFEQPTLTLAKALLGKLIVHELPEGRLVARIVETEAYMGEKDRAAHSYGKRRTKRTEIMFAKAGHVYTYRMHTHTLINVVGNEEGTPEAILIRAVEPLEGLNLMQQLRGLHVKQKDWTNGPGKLTKALGITMDYYGHHWTQKPLYIAEGEEPLQIETGPRVGIQNTGEAVHYPWRFWIKGNPYVSKYR